MHQTAGIEQMNTPAPITIRVQNVFKVQCRLTEQGLCALLLKAG